MAESTRGGPDSRFNENLIKEVKKHPIVYDTSHPFYSNGAQKQLAWNEIADTLCEKVEVAKTRWRTLRDRYTKERRRVLTSGGGSSFSYYADLNFLDAFAAENRNTRRNTNTSTTHVKSEFYDHISNTDGIFENQTGATKMANDSDDITILDNAETATLDSERMSPSESSKNVNFVPPTTAQALKEDVNELQSKRADGGDSAAQGTSSDTVTVALVTFLDHLNHSRQKRLHPRKRDIRDSANEKAAVTDPSLLSERVSPSETTNPLPQVISNVNSFETPSKRPKMTGSESHKVTTDTVAIALMRSAEALQRLAERKCIFDQSASGTRDVDECFADFVCLSLKSIDSENRVHARIAILHALAQFQT